MKHSAIFCSVMLLGASAGAAADSWQVSGDQSAVKFTFTQQGTKYTGRFEEFEADIDIDPADVESGSIIGTVRTESVNSRDYDRDANLRSAEWFNSEEHPQARFESESISMQSDGSYTASGQLTIKGTTKPADLNFTFEAADGSMAEFMGTLEVDRFDYNVGEGWNDTSWVGQDVEVEIDLDLSAAGS